MPAFLVRLDAGLSGRTLHNGVDALVVFAEDDEAAIDIAVERFPGLTGWNSATAVDLSEMGEDVDTEDGVFVELRQT